MCLLAHRVRLTAISTVYQTEPIGRPEQAAYYNCVVQLETPLAPRPLRDVLREIESQLHRRRSADKYASRTIDLDLIVYDDVAQDDADFPLPDPEVLRRPFLLVCLAELDPHRHLPGMVVSLSEASKEAAVEGIVALVDFTSRLRKLLP